MIAMHVAHTISKLLSHYETFASNTILKSSSEHLLGMSLLLFISHWLVHAWRLLAALDYLYIAIQHYRLALYAYVQSSYDVVWISIRHPSFTRTMTTTVMAPLRTTTTGWGIFCVDYMYLNCALYFKMPSLQIFYDKNSNSYYFVHSIQTLVFNSFVNALIMAVRSKFKFEIVVLNQEARTHMDDDLTQWDAKNLLFACTYWRQTLRFCIRITTTQFQNQ